MFSIGIKTKESVYFNTIIDGEHIWNSDINMYTLLIYTI